MSVTVYRTKPPLEPLNHCCDTHAATHATCDETGVQIREVLMNQALAKGAVHENPISSTGSFALWRIAVYVPGPEISTSVTLFHLLVGLP